MQTGIKQVYIKKQNLNFHSVHSVLISLSLIISVHINGKNTSSWLQFKILVLARDNDSCSFLLGRYHAAESIRAGNARPNSVVANVKLYCLWQMWYVWTTEILSHFLVLTNAGWAPKKKHSPASLKSIPFCTYFQINFLNFCPVKYDRNISLQREKESCKDSFNDYNKIQMLDKNAKKRIELLVSQNILYLKITCTYSAKTKLSVFNILITCSLKKVRTYTKRLICTFWNRN